MNMARKQFFVHHMLTMLGEDKNEFGSGDESELSKEEDVLDQGELSMEEDVLDQGELSKEEDVRDQGELSKEEDVLDQGEHSMEEDVKDSVNSLRKDISKFMLAQKHVEFFMISGIGDIRCFDLFINELLCEIRLNSLRKKMS